MSRIGSNRRGADGVRVTEETGGKAKAGNLTEAKGNKARADYLATEAKGGKAGTEEDSNRHEAATEMIHEQGEEFPFVMGREIPRNEIRMVINQRTETGIQTSETGQRVGEQWESQWRNTNWRKRFDYWLKRKEKSTMVQDRRCHGKGGKEAGGSGSIKMISTLAKGGRYQGI